MIMTLDKHQICLKVQGNIPIASTSFHSSYQHSTPVGHIYSYTDTCTLGIISACMNDAMKCADDEVDSWRADYAATVEHV